MKVSSKIGNLVVDTSVLIEYIIENTPYRETLDKLFEQIKKQTITIFVSPITLTEVLYVSDRVYKIAKIEDSNLQAKKYIQWIKTLAKIAPINEEIMELAGEIKKKYHLSISDSYAIATGIFLDHKILFKTPEKEMQKHLSNLKKLGVIFLSDFDKPG